MKDRCRGTAVKLSRHCRTKLNGQKRKYVTFKYLQIADPEYEGHPSEGRAAAVRFVTLIITADPVRAWGVPLM